MMKGYVKHSLISLPSTRKPKPNLSRLVRLVEMKKAYDNSMERYRRAYQRNALQDVDMWNCSLHHHQGTFRRLSSRDAAFRLIRTRLMQVTIH